MNPNLELRNTVPIEGSHTQGIKHSFARDGKRVVPRLRPWSFIFKRSWEEAARAANNEFIVDD